MTDKNELFERNVLSAEVIAMEDSREHYCNAEGVTDLCHGSVDAAAFDLRANVSEPLRIPAGGCLRVGTGLKVWIRDPNFAGHIIPRSGLGNRGIVLGNLHGLIDADYQGELIVSVWNRGHEDFYLNPGERFAQYYIAPVYRLKPVFVDEFTNVSERGADGFGSSGQQ